MGCEEMKPKKELVRILKTPEDEIVMDLTGKKNGRGAYICRSQECLMKSRRNKGIERALKVTVPAEIYETLLKEMIEVEAGE